MSLQLDLPGLSPAGSLRYALTWLMTDALQCKFWTRKMHADHVRYLLEYFGDRQLTEITYPAIKGYLDDEVARGLARETARKRLSTLHMALSEAVRMGWIEKVPPWPVIKTDSRPKDAFWTLSQWEDAHRECDADDDFRTWIALGWYTGMHSSDLDRCRWEDIKLDKATWVRRNTKTGVKPVELPLPARLLQILTDRYLRLQPHRRDLVSGRRMGHPNRPLKELCRRAGVPLISPIGLRHSCESWLEERGTTELFQMTWLGLKSPAMLKKVYRHMTPRGLDGGIAALNAA